MFEDAEFEQETDTDIDTGDDKDTPNQEVGNNLEGDFDSDDGVAEHLKVKEEAPAKEEQQEPDTKEEPAATDKKEEQFPERPLEEVEKEYNRLVKDGVNEFISLQKSFLAVAKASEGIDYTPEQAFQYGIETGDYDAFLACLSPLEVKRFIQEKGELDSRYNDALEKVNKEKEHKIHHKAKQEDISKWDGYITEHLKESPAKAYMLNKLKQESGFSKEKLDSFCKWMDEALALEQNIQKNKQDTADFKKAMMGTAPAVSKTGSRDYASLSDEEILSLPPKEYEKWKNSMRRK